jgi:hypothetical protein
MELLIPTIGEFEIDVAQYIYEQRFTFKTVHGVQRRKFKTEALESQRNWFWKNIRKRMKNRLKKIQYKIKKRILTRVKIKRII